ncbi:MAG: Hpt domain-containing protein [Polyangiales bacterium]
MSDDGVDEEIAALRAAYALGLPAKAHAVAAATRKTAIEPASAEEAIALAHRLRGTAGAYGFPAVSKAAGAIEEALRAGVRDSSLEALADAMDAAGEAVSAPRRET